MYAACIAYLFSLSTKHCMGAHGCPQQERQKRRKKRKRPKSRLYSNSQPTVKRSADAFGIVHDCAHNSRVKASADSDGEK